MFFYRGACFSWHFTARWGFRAADMGGGLCTRRSRGFRAMRGSSLRRRLRYFRGSCTEGEEVRVLLQTSCSFCRWPPPALLACFFGCFFLLGVLDRRPKKGASSTTACASSFAIWPTPRQCVCLLLLFYILQHRVRHGCGGAIDAPAREKRLYVCRLGATTAITFGF
jgi:hypothetical protein